MTLTILRKLLGKEERKLGPYDVQVDNETISVEKFSWPCGCYVREPTSGAFEGYRRRFCDKHKDTIERALLNK